LNQVLLLACGRGGENDGTRVMGQNRNSYGRHKVRAEKEIPRKKKKGFHFLKEKGKVSIRGLDAHYT
jgi:hypothetical protein